MGDKVHGASYLTDECCSRAGARIAIFGPRQAIIAIQQKGGISIPILQRNFKRWRRVAKRFSFAALEQWWGRAAAKDAVLALVNIVNNWRAIFGLRNR